MTRRKGDEDGRELAKGDMGARSKPRARLNPEDVGFLDSIKEQLTARPKDRNVLINVPIWGWTGDGKTCAMLTAIHFCEPAQHPLGFSLVTNPDELVDLEKSVENYQGLNLAGIATATTSRLRELGELFIDNNEWPPGTDEPSAYILAVRDIASTLGYVLFPDIKGGSFRELDEAARDVLRKAHAAILIVNPALYDSSSTDGRRYRDEILARLQQFSESDVPVCIMITKSDLYPHANQAVDNTHKKLTIVVESQAKLVGLLARVTVIGTGVSLVNDKPPPVSERNPDQLTKAWIWIVAQGLCREAKKIRDLLPSTNIRSLNETPRSGPSQVIAELREVGDYSDCPGVAVCAGGEESSTSSLTFVSKTGVLSELSVGSPEDAGRQTLQVGLIPEWKHEIDVHAAYIGGEYVVGPKAKANFVWQGAKGGTLTKCPLPFEMVSWAPAGARKLVALDAAGRLHSLRFEATKWVQADYLESSIAPTPLMTCAFDEAASHVYLYNGATTVCVALGPDGKFRERIEPQMACSFDGPVVRANRAGVCIASTKAGQAIMAGVPKGAELGAIKPDAPVPFAIAPITRRAAILGSDMRLSAMSVNGDGLRKTAPNYSPILHAPPTSLVWSRRGEFLVATFADDTWKVFKPLGLQA